MPNIKKATIKKEPTSAHCTFNAIVINDPYQIVSTVQGKIYSSAQQPTPEFLAYTLDYSSETSGKRLFVNNSVAFSGGNPIGFEYDVLLTMYDSSGKVIDTPTTLKITVGEAIPVT